MTLNYEQARKLREDAEYELVNHLINESTRRFKVYERDLIMKTHGDNWRKDNGK